MAIGVVFVAAPVIGAEIIGTDDSERLVGTDEADLIRGHGGLDIIEGLRRGDVLYCGPGNDRVRGHSGRDVITP